MRHGGALPPDGGKHYWAQLGDRRLVPNVPRASASSRSSPRGLDRQIACPLCRGTISRSVPDPMPLTKGHPRLERQNNHPARISSRRAEVATNSMFDIFFDHLHRAAGSRGRRFPRRAAQTCGSRRNNRYLRPARRRRPIRAGGLLSASDRRECRLKRLKDLSSPDETSPQAALRELAEETGLSCPAANLIGLGTWLRNPGSLTAASPCLRRSIVGGTTSDRRQGNRHGIGPITTARLTLKPRSPPNGSQTRSRCCCCADIAPFPRSDAHSRLYAANLAWTHHRLVGYKVGTSGPGAPVGGLAAP